MFQPAGLRTLMKMRNSEPTRPATALERRVDEEREWRPLTAPPDLPTSSESRVAEALQPADETDGDQEPDEELLAHVSATLHDLQTSWQEERRTAAAALWHELQATKPIKNEDELGELEDVAKVRALDECANRSRELAVSDAEEVLLLVDSFRSAIASSGDPEAALEQACALEEQRLAKTEARARALEEAWTEKPEAEAAAGPAPDSKECASLEEASLDLQAARSWRQQFEEQRRSGYSLDAAPVEVVEGARLRGLRQDVQRLKDKVAWAADAEKAAGPACQSAPSRTASPCRRRVASTAADEGAGAPATELALGAWVDDLRSFIDCKLFLQDVNEDGSNMASRQVLEGSSASSPSSPPSKHKEQKASGIGGGPEAGAGFTGQLWRTTAKQGASWSPKRLSDRGAAEAEAAAGLPQQAEPCSANFAIDPLAQLDDILKEFDEIDRIHSNICKLSSWS
eukprot:TRINITY_DN12864_c0_g1_i1.p1 TRINITY_DN12864_c0_g1~~TRINITY_DN12864_c0_g1_i1.p1  ORF type:complete len:457 (+),score=118.34 TRINITY_DN12864_c0_g1_i1:121-1491(+)